MGNINSCFQRDKNDYIKYEGRHVYCETCLARISYDKVYIMAHTSRTHIFCSQSCYGFWLAND